MLYGENSFARLSPRAMGSINRLEGMIHMIQHSDDTPLVSHKSSQLELSHDTKVYDLRIITLC